MVRKGCYLLFYVGFIVSLGICAMDDSTVPIYLLEEEDSPIASLALASSGRKIAFNQGFSCGLLDIESCAEDNTLLEKPVARVVFVPEEDNLIGIVHDDESGFKHKVRLWDLRLPKKDCGIEITATKDPLSDPICFASDGKEYFWGDKKGVINCCMDEEYPYPLQVMMRNFPMSGIKDWHTKHGNKLDNRLLHGSVLSSYGQQTRCSHLFFLSHFMVMEKIKGHTMPITSLALSPDDVLLASGSSDKCVKVWGWDTIGENEQPLCNSIEFEAAVPRALTFDGQGRNLIVGLSNGEIVIRPVLNE